MTDNRLQDRLVKRQTIESKDGKITTEWFSNPSNYTDDTAAIRAGEKETAIERAVYRYHFCLFILYIFAAVALNLIVATWQYYVENVFDYALWVQVFLFYVLARFWKIDNHIASEIVLFFKRFV